MFKSEVAKQPWFITILKEVENARKVGNTGNLWVPHSSPEGGADTIGYGHKISGTGIVKINGIEYDLNTDHIPNKAIDYLLVQDIALAEKKAAKEFTELQPQGKKTKWDELPIQYKTIYTEIVYNVGTLKNKKTGKWGWNKLSKGMKDDNHPVILSQLMRKFTDKKGVVKPLTTRVNKLKKVYNAQLGESKLVPPKMDVMRNMFPSFDILNKRVQARLMAKVFAEERQLELEREQAQNDYNTLMDEANERDRETQRLRRERQEEQRQAEETLQTEVDAEISASNEEESKKVNQRLEEIDRDMRILQETSKRTSSVAQFFQREDGKIIKVQEGKEPEELF